MIGRFEQDVRVELPGANPLGGAFIAVTLNQIYREEWKIAKMQRSHVNGCIAEQSDYDYVSAVNEPKPATIYIGRQ